MAEEEIKDLSTGGEEVPAKAANPFITLLIILITMPVLSYLMVQFLFVPQFKAAAKTAAAEALGLELEESGHEGGGGDAHGGGDGHGGGHEEAAGNVYEFNDIVANLSGSLKSRFVKISFVVQGSDPDFRVKVEESRVKLVDTTLGVLSSLTILDVEDPGIKNILRSDLLAAYENLLGMKLIEEIYFSEFVVQ